MTLTRSDIGDDSATSRDAPLRAAQMQDQRREGSRRSATSGRFGGASTSVSERPVSAYYLISREWVLMSPIMAAGFVVTGIGTMSIPSVTAAVLALIAVVIAGFGGFFVRYERETAGNLGSRIATMSIAVALPMLLFGIALADWVHVTGTYAWDTVVGILTIISVVGSVTLTGRLPTIAAATMSLWLASVIVSEALVSYLLFGIGFIVSGVAIARQIKVDDQNRAQQQELDRRQARAESILADYEQTGQGWFWETDRRGTINYISPTIAKLLGRKAESLLGRPFTDLFILDAEGQEGERTLNFHLSARSSFAELAVRAATKDEERWWSINGRPVHDHFNNFMGFRGSGSDLTEKKRSAENATRLAHYDSLTGLANRFQMAQTLEKILSAQREEQRSCAVFLLDLDRFKQVNDTMGHPAGDALLKQVSQRLERTVGELGRVGRLGGDEFKVVIPGRVTRDNLASLAKRIIENLSQPYTIEGHSVVIGASVGIALSPDDGVTSEELIRNSDLALYAAKDGGRGRHHFYAADLHSDAEERRQLEQDLRDAIISGGLELYYQPVVHTMTEKITGFEALLRWNHPVQGPLSPAKFIPIAEEAGLISQIGEWALRTACHELAKWPESVRVAVNVSPLQFANPALPSIVTNALAAAQIDPARLELEITESVFLNDDSGTDAMFAALKRVGVRLALDDFGTGYSSLGYLRKAPFDKIKIDQSFVRGATIKGSRNGAIIASIVSLAESLGMETTAEGVETLDELDLVRMLGCSHIQGYIYEKPLNASSAKHRLDSGLIAIASGPRSARPVRQTMLRKITLQHGAEVYNGTIRNISTTGALVEGLWNVPAGTVFNLQFTADQVVAAICRWSRDDRMGMEFAEPMVLDESGMIGVNSPKTIRLATDTGLLRKAG